MVGDLDTHDAPCRMLCRHAGVDVLSVEYRKAPEHPFPSYVEDARRAYEWAAERYERVAVGGDSAGGNLAATIAIEYDPALALLIYPVVDATAGAALAQAVRRGLLPHRRADDSGTRATSCPRARTAPTRCARRSCHPRPGGLGARRWWSPPASTRCATRARPTRTALREAGVPALAHRFRGLFHGFINSIGASPSSRDALVEVAGMTRALLRAG